MAEGVSVVVFEGSAPGSPVEEMMARVRRAALLDNLDKLKSVPLVKETYLITNDPVLAAEARAAGALVLLNDIPPTSFHFGRALQEMLAGYGLKKVCYYGLAVPRSRSRKSNRSAAAAGADLCSIPITPSPPILSLLPSGRTARPVGCR